jgi:hypothetical protein
MYAHYAVPFSFQEFATDLPRIRTSTVCTAVPVVLVHSTSTGTSVYLRIITVQHYSYPARVRSTSTVQVVPVVPVHSTSTLYQHCTSTALCALYHDPSSISNGSSPTTSSSTAVALRVPVYARYQYQQYRQY